MRRRNVVLLACLVGVLGCGRSQPQGHFGAYRRTDNKILRLASGDTFTVYRVKYWLLRDGSPPALQLEYAPPFPVSDTARLHALTYRLWPAFAPYVRAADTRVAILTATNLVWRGNALAWRATFNHFGLIAERDSAGTWRLNGERFPLPPAEEGAPPRIFEASGKPLAFQDIGALVASKRGQ